MESKIAVVGSLSKYKVFLYQEKLKHKFKGSDKEFEIKTGYHPVYQEKQIYDHWTEVKCLYWENGEYPKFSVIEKEISSSIIRNQNHDS